jgi:uncharacterized protein YbjT (DUF2867 family)
VYLVAGTTGNVGREVAQTLADAGQPVRSLRRRRVDPGWWSAT